MNLILYENNLMKSQFYGPPEDEGKIDLRPIIEKIKKQEEKQMAYRPRQPAVGAPQGRTKAQRPIYSGDVGSRTPPYEKIGTIALWENTSETPRAPELTGTYTDLQGRKFGVSLWKRS